MSARYQLPQRATCSSLAGPGFCIYDAAAELHPGAPALLPRSLVLLSYSHPLTMPLIMQLVCPASLASAFANVTGNGRHTGLDMKAVAHLTCSWAAARAGAEALHARQQQPALHSYIHHTSTVKIEPYRGAHPA